MGKENYRFPKLKVSCLFVTIISWIWTKQCNGIYLTSNIWRQSLESCDFKTNLLMWRHLDTSSVFLLSMLVPSYNAISSFSDKQRLHLIEARLNGGHFLTIFQVTLGVLFFRFNLQNSFESSDSFSYFSWLKLFLWLEKRFLKVVAVDPR